MRAEQATDRRPAMSLGHVAQRVRGVIEGDVPIDLLPFAALLHHGFGQSVGGTQALVGETLLVREPALVDVVVLQRQHAHHLVVLGLHDQVAAQRIVGAHRLAARELPGAGREAEGLGGQRADRAEVDDVAGKFGVDGLADERHHLGALAAIGLAEFHEAGDLGGEADTARAVDAAGHVGRHQWTEVLVGYDALFFLVFGSRVAVTDG